MKTWAQICKHCTSAVLQKYKLYVQILFLFFSVQAGRYVDRAGRKVVWAGRKGVWAGYKSVR